MAEQPSVEALCEMFSSLSEATVKVRAGWSLRSRWDRRLSCCLPPSLILPHHLAPPLPLPFTQDVVEQCGNNCDVAMEHLLAMADSPSRPERLAPAPAAPRTRQVGHQPSKQSSRPLGRPCCPERGSRAATCLEQAIN